MTSSHQKEIEALAASNYEKTIGRAGVTNGTLSSYFTGCFNDVCRVFALYKCWICVACLASKRFSYGWGDKPKTCPECGKPTYEVATFQARASHVGRGFQYACLHLLKKCYGIDARLTGETTGLYDFEIKPDVVVEAKGSSKFVVNPDKSKSSLERSGMIRSDTEKKAFANAAKWKLLFPDGHFFILTNSIPNHLRAFKSEAISGIIDVTKKNQLEEFVSEIRNL